VALSENKFSVKKTGPSGFFPQQHTTGPSAAIHPVPEFPSLRIPAILSDSLETALFIRRTGENWFFSFGTGHTFTRRPPRPDMLSVQPVCMEDKRYSNPVTYWCYKKEPGNESASGRPLPCKKDACEWYRAEYPYCIHMERRDRRGFVIA
jgi:hypothetical protein